MLEVDFLPDFSRGTILCEHAGEEHAFIGCWCEFVECYCKQ